MTIVTAFQPYVNYTVTATAGPTAGNITLPTRASNAPDVVRLYNAGPSTAFVEISGGTATISTSMPIFAGATPEKFACPPGVTTISIITAAGTAVIYATLGQGN